jgi:DNA-binding CsgD family transcriptional regulator
MDKKLQDMHPSENELTFLQYAASELTYKQIAAQMHLAERTIDGYRESLFSKMKVQTRVGMVLEGIRLGLVKTKRK